MSVCPFGAMNYNLIDKKVFKCDLCGGKPQCVRFCDIKAVNFVSSDSVSVKKSEMPLPVFSPRRNMRQLCRNKFNGN